MDNEMIVDFINNVEPDFSYGTSDGMSRAMVESAENIARINDYITESVYEVYTEADDSDKPGFLGKIANKIGIYFTLFMNIIKKFITKIKGFFMTINRKITMGFTNWCDLFWTKEQAETEGIPTIVKEWNQIHENGVTNKEFEQLKF